MVKLHFLSGQFEWKALSNLRNDKIDFTFNGMHFGQAEKLPVSFGIWENAVIFISTLVAFCSCDEQLKKWPYHSLYHSFVCQQEVKEFQCYLKKAYKLSQI